MRYAPLSLLLLAGCLVDQRRGPDVGNCAAYPDGTYSYGEIGIGTCLAGPTDLRFLERDGRTWLAVTNSDPFRTFLTGSLTLVDWDSVEVGRSRQTMGALEAFAVDTDLFVGQIGAYEDTLLIPSKYSADSRTAAAYDDVLIVDISDPTEPSVRERVEVRQDPHPIAVDELTGLAYVVNTTGTSVSILDAASDPVEVVPVSEGAAVYPARFFDEDASGSAGEIGLSAVVNGPAVAAERYTFTWIDLAQRAWLPAAGGVELWTSGGREWFPAPSDLLLTPTETTPYSVLGDATFATIDGRPSLHFADAGNIYAVLSPAGPADFSTNDVTTALQGAFSGETANYLGGPSLVTYRDLPQMFFDAREEAGSDAHIERAFLGADGSWVREESPLIVAPEGFASVEAPAVVADAQYDGLRAWFSMWNGERWSIGLAESQDGDNFTVPEEVLALEGAHAAAPVIGWANGRFVMLLSVSEGSAWEFATSWSWDGRDWSFPEPFAVSSDPFLLDSPPRAAASNDSQGFFRTEGDDIGLIEQPAVSGATWTSGAGGFSVRPATGFELGLATFGTHSRQGIEPAAYAEVEGTSVLYALTTDSTGKTQLAALTDRGDRFETLASGLLDVPGDIDGVALTRIDEEWLLFFGERDAEGVTRLRRARSVDGLTFVPDEGALLDDGAEWDGLARIPHSVDAEGRLWYAGSDGSRFRVGAAQIAGDELVRLPGADQPWLLANGLPGEFDDSGVRDPLVFTHGGLTQMLYAGSDGTTWRLGHAVLGEDGIWTRPEHPLTDQPSPTLVPIGRTFSTGGVTRPVLLSNEADRIWLAYTGSDGVSPRVGLATGVPSQLYGAHRFPTAGDNLQFSTDRGGPAAQFIELAQATDDFATSGLGAKNARLDPERGFLYVPTQQSPHLIVIDVRDDSGVEADANYRELEAVFRYSSSAGARGFRDALPRPGTDLLYATATDPDSVLVFDLTQAVDDSEKQALDNALLWSFPLGRAPQNDFNRPTQDEDEGSESLSRVTGAGMAVTDDGSLLLVTHSRGNRVLVFDLTLGAYGEEIRAIDGVGELPHTVRISPDGRHAVVANYVGEVGPQGAEGTLAIIDLDRNSPTFLQVVTRITNR